MKRKTLNRLILIACFVIPLAVIWVAWGGGLMPRVWQLNQMIKQDPVLAEYPYRFRAVLLASGVATLTRPHDGQVPAILFLEHVEPELATKSPNDPAILAAHDRLREHENRAARVALMHPEVDSVEWVLDRAWFHREKIPIPPKIGP
ncbi:hypothetical protein ABC977_12020 [Thioalkalicoccus limnaeus]|uniref:Glutamate-ammonia-ligase adenylyltransferase n=1 Tax=Thioalkalicoccus limnaeus TaxID=120681 RepID=A0ABV4BF15_9GAMM